MSKSINPKLSVWAGKNKPQRNDKLKESNLYVALKRCEEISTETPKGQAGQIFPFVANTIGSEFKSSDGVLFMPLVVAEELPFPLLLLLLLTVSVSKS